MTVLYDSVYTKVWNRQKLICNGNNQNSGCLREVGGVIGKGQEGTFWADAAILS